MYERFTDRARKVMQLTTADAIGRGHEYIGTEHILLGLVAEGSGVASIVLRNLGIEAEHVRGQIEKISLPRLDGVSMERLPQTPRAKHVIELAMEEAREARLPYVGTEHLLIALLREDECVAAQILMNLGLSLDKLRAAVVQAQGQLLDTPAFQNRISSYLPETEPQTKKSWFSRLFRGLAAQWHVNERRKKGSDVANYSLHLHSEYACCQTRP